MSLVCVLLLHKNRRTCLPRYHEFWKTFSSYSLSTFQTWQVIKSENLQREIVVTIFRIFFQFLCIFSPAFYFLSPALCIFILCLSYLINYVSHLSPFYPSSKKLEEIYIQYLFSFSSNIGRIYVPFATDFLLVNNFIPLSLWVDDKHLVLPLWYQWLVELTLNAYHLLTASNTLLSKWQIILMQSTETS